MTPFLAPEANTYTVFDGNKRIASGPLATVAVAAKKATEDGSNFPVLIFDNSTGRSIDVDMRGSDEDIYRRLDIRDRPLDLSTAFPAEQHKGPGRPKQGVVGREVTLLPRHWEWLASQPGGASVALRKLVEAARRDNEGKDKRRKARDRAYFFMSAMAGDLPGFEEASRALFADDQARFAQLVSPWPPEIAKHVTDLAFGE